jgi:hypothetical protein
LCWTEDVKSAARGNPSGGKGDRRNSAQVGEGTGLTSLALIVRKAVRPASWDKCPWFQNPREMSPDRFSWRPEKPSARRLQMLVWQTFAARDLAGIIGSPHPAMQSGTFSCLHAIYSQAVCRKTTPAACPPEPHQEIWTC